MKIYKTLISFTDAHLGKIMRCDTIELDDNFWLVPEWRENTDTGKMKAARIILLSSLPHQKADAGIFGDFVLNEPIPKCVFDGITPSQTKLDFHIVENPEIWVDIPDEFSIH